MASACMPTPPACRLSFVTARARPSCVTMRNSASQCASAMNINSPPAHILLPRLWRREVPHGLYAFPAPPASASWGAKLLHFCENRIARFAFVEAPPDAKHRKTPEKRGISERKRAAKARAIRGVCVKGEFFPRPGCNLRLQKCRKSAIIQTMFFRFYAVSLKPFRAYARCKIGKKR